MEALRMAAPLKHKIENAFNNFYYDATHSKIAKFASNVLRGGLIGAAGGGAVFAGLSLKSVVWLVIFAAIGTHINFPLLGTIAGVSAAILIGGGFIGGAIYGAYMFSQGKTVQI
jgi:hypothetical protein